MIGLIKNSKIPIICMCNDRNHMKIRSLSNYCFDLRFQRPRLEQIKVLARSLAHACMHTLAKDMVPNCRIPKNQNSSFQGKKDLDFVSVQDDPALAVK